MDAEKLAVLKEPLPKVLVMLGRDSFDFLSSHLGTQVVRFSDHSGCVIGMINIACRHEKYQDILLV